MSQFQAIPLSDLPDGSKRQMDFLDSSFFQDPDQSLPTPAQVLALSGKITSPQPPPVVFTNPDVLVKFGPHVPVAEAQCLWMIQRVFQGKVPVPEVYGWRVDEKGHVFIYMDHVKGQTLFERWDTLTGAEIRSLRHQLCDIVGSLRELQQDPADQSFIGSIARQPLLDYVFENQTSAGPFPTIKDFNNWLTSLPQLHLPTDKKYKDPYREFLPDTGQIRFTHADLHRANVIISSTSPVRVLAIVDWTQSGWYPDYWEYCKALYTTWEEDEWRWGWVDKVLEPRMQEFFAFIETTMAIGAV